jgi:hypothetical protein
MFLRLRRGLGDSHRGMSSALGSLDEFFHPGAAQARELMDSQHERVIATPSPGDRLLNDGHVTIEAEDDHPSRLPGDADRELG